MRRTLFYILFLLTSVTAVSNSYCIGDGNYSIRIKKEQNPYIFKTHISEVEAYINTSMGYICVEFNANLGDTQVCIIDQFNSVVSSTTCSANTGTTVYINTPQDSGFYTITITSNIYSGFGNFTIQ